MLIILTVVFSAWLFVMMVLWINEHGPSGHYPIPFFLCAIGPVAAAFFGLGILVLRMFGLKFGKEADKKEHPIQQAGPANGSHPIRSETNGTSSAPGSHP